MKDTSYKFTWTNGLIGIEDCKQIRQTVFVDEQGFSAELEFDEIDAYTNTYHLFMRIDGNPAAAARIFMDKTTEHKINEDKKEKNKAKSGESHTWHAGRICILPRYRGIGAGLLLMQEIERKVIELLGREIILSSQVRAAPFYEKAGYSAYGEEFYDEHCPHINMVRRLWQ